jgi:undecaprenyl-diphosphatase
VSLHLSFPLTAVKLYGVPRSYGTPILSLVAVIAFICLAGTVEDGSTAGFDASVRESIHSFSSLTLTNLFLVISFTGKLLFLIGLGSLISIIFLLRRKLRWLAVFLITMAGEIVLEVGTKAIFERVRPDPFFGLPPAESYSFPSGHALGSICFYGVLAWLVLKGQSSLVRTLVFGVAGMWVLLIGTARVYLGMHYPSDVLGGFLLGSAWLAAVIVISRRKEGG